ncbi:MAG TPA: SWIM zinc finger family protein [Polyangiaceae bacterium]|nr:SWIM zinc finger family protein [Polyangiaceae bacterium]
MNRWNRFDRFEATPKKPPPERGIRMKKAGTTWWGQRWIQALQSVLSGDAGRLARGRTYARAGRTHDLIVQAGKVTAKVTGSRATPYEITIELVELTAPVWQKAIEGLAQKAQFSAELLAGQMPRAIDEVFISAGESLFPTRRADLETKCSCPDWGDPCKHVAATHYVLGEALDRDPFLLFELRGRTKDEVLGALRAARGAASEPPAGKGPGRESTPAEGGTEVPAVRLGQLNPGEYDKPRGPLPNLHFSFDEPVSHGAVLRQLGAPDAWASNITPADTLSPLVQAAAETARRIAMSEPSEVASSRLPPKKRSARARKRKHQGRDE